jgi:putative membrane protein
MVFLLVNWVAGTVALLLLANIFPGFRIGEFQSVLFAAGTVGLISAAVSLVFRQIISPVGLAMSALILAGVDTFVFRVTALLVPGFAMRAFYPAVVGALLLSAIFVLLVWLMRPRGAVVESESLMQL